MYGIKYLEVRKVTARGLASSDASLGSLIWLPKVLDALNKRLRSQKKKTPGFRRCNAIKICLEKRRRLIISGASSEVVAKRKRWLMRHLVIFPIVN